MGASKTALYGLATRCARHRGPQRTIARFLAEVARATVPEKDREKFLRYVDRISAASGIESRHSVLPDYTAADPSDFVFYPKRWSLDPLPTTEARMRVYEKESVELATSAARQAIAGVDPRRISHLIITSCTGFFAPGPDVLLADRIGLRPSVERTIVGFMGCYAHFAALRLADQIVRANEDAIVLTVAIELCSLHYQRTPTIEALISNCLFGDGAAAALFGASGKHGKQRGEIASALSLVHAESRDQMSWHIGDHGFVMALDGKVPNTLGREVPPFFAALIEKARVRKDEIGAYAIHPGGKKVVEAIGAALELGPEALHGSFEVLRRYGNMSSATILFVLESELERLERENLPGHVAMLGFGPGLTMEGAVLLRGRHVS
jgi:predicted naringenin-chalcone synthase